MSNSEIAIDWSLYPNFQAKEFVCSHSGECYMHPQFLEVLQRIRSMYGEAMIISSGYRSIAHPEEVNKLHPGEHTLGLAADILCSGTNAIRLLQSALKCGIRRIGINQKGPHKSRYLHCGIADQFGLMPPALWTY